MEAFAVHYQVKEDVRKQRTAKQPSARRCKPSEPRLVEARGGHCVALKAERAEAGGGARGPLPGEDGRAAQRAALQDERAEAVEALGGSTTR